MTYKLTLDKNLMGPEVNIPAMNTLKRWKEEGKVDLIEADRPSEPKDKPYGWPGAPPKAPDDKPAWKGSRSRAGKMHESGKATFKSVAAVLFPGKDPLKLNMSEINDVAHLIRHHSVKNEIFVTANEKDFIQGGRRDQLKTYFGIITMTPAETVEMLGQLQGWESGNGKGKKAAAKPKAK